MRFSLRRITHKDFDPDAQDPVQAPNAWKVYQRWDQSGGGFLEQQLREMQRPDQKAVLRGLRKLLNVVAQGQPIENFYDGKQCHETHKFNYGGKIRTIWRIRNSDIRLCFYYGQERVILLTHIFPKHTDKLSDSQKAELEKTVKSYIDAEDKQSLKFIGDD